MNEYLVSYYFRNIFFGRYAKPLLNTSKKLKDLSIRSLGMYFATALNVFLLSFAEKDRYFPFFKKKTKREIIFPLNNTLASKRST